MTTVLPQKTPRNNFTTIRFAKTIIWEQNIIEYNDTTTFDVRFSYTPTNLHVEILIELHTYPTELTQKQRKYHNVTQAFMSTAKVVQHFAFTSPTLHQLQHEITLATPKILIPKNKGNYYENGNSYTAPVYATFCEYLNSKIYEKYYQYRTKNKPLDLPRVR